MFDTHEFLHSIGVRLADAAFQLIDAGFRCSLFTSRAGASARPPRNQNSTAAAGAPGERAWEPEERSHVDAIRDRWRAGIPPTGAVAGYRLRCLRAARLQIRSRQR